MAKSYIIIPAQASDSEEKCSLIEVRSALYLNLFKKPLSAHLLAAFNTVKWRNVPSESCAEIKRPIILQTSSDGGRW